MFNVFSDFSRLDAGVIAQDWFSLFTDEKFFKVPAHVGVLVWLVVETRSLRVEHFLDRRTVSLKTE